MLFKKAHSAFFLPFSIKFTTIFYCIYKLLQKLGIHSPQSRLAVVQTKKQRGKKSAVKKLLKTLDNVQVNKISDGRKKQ